MRRVADFILGVTVALLAIAMVYVFAPDAMIPRRLTCGVSSADGCMAWVDKARIKRYEQAKAGT